MCSLCGVLGGRGHWTDTSSNPDAFRAAAPTTIAGEQQARTTLVNKVLKHYGLALSDWAPGSFMLRSHTGSPRRAGTGRGRMWSIRGSHRKTMVMARYPSNSFLPD